MDFSVETDGKISITGLTSGNISDFSNPSAASSTDEIVAFVS